MKIEKDILTVFDASKICGVTRTTMWRWIKSGELKSAATAGGHHRIHKDDLHNLIIQKKMYNRFRGNTGKHRILICDDDPQLANLLIKALTIDGYEVEAVSDGFGAGILTMRFKPHLIILDLIMPQIDGFEVCKILKENSVTANIKIIAISGYDTEENRERILKYGADIFMGKPFDINIIIKETGRLLTQTSAHK